MRDFEVVREEHMLEQSSLLLKHKLLMRKTRTEPAGIL